MSEAFITIIEDFLGVKRTPISIIDTWASGALEEARGKPLLEYLEMVRAWSCRTLSAPG